jgi:hypothetical protein
MMVVQIEKPANMALAAWFTELRSWFDENNCQPASFVSAGRVIDKLLFNATFVENTQARLFAANFTRYAPSIRRATSSRRSEIWIYDDLGRMISDEV